MLEDMTCNRPVAGVAKWQEYTAEPNDYVVRAVRFKQIWQNYSPQTLSL